MNYNNNKLIKTYYKLIKKKKKKLWSRLRSEKNKDSLGYYVKLLRFGLE